METFEERFWRHVEKGDGCWLWTGRTIVDGYGRIRIDNNFMELARRLTVDIVTVIGYDK